MSGHKEKAEWKTAEDDLRRDGKRTYGRRPAPFYKVFLPFLDLIVADG